jgi:hypothetical protein
MNVYKILTNIHIVFTIAALLSGLISIVANPKGGAIHKKFGRLYYYFYLVVIFTALAMLTIKFKFFFLGLTVFGAYLIASGNYYSKQNEKIEKRNWWLLSLGVFTIIVYILDISLVISNIENYEYGWIIVHFTFAALAISVFIFELNFKRNRILLHATTMLLTYIPLINGLLARFSPNEYVWFFWIIGYIIFIPFIILWFKKSKQMQELLKLKE